METTLLAAAIQASFLLGLLHGVNPCGHSWLVLAPFVSGEKNGGRVFLLSIAFLGGTALACLVLGVTLGTVSQSIPLEFGFWIETGTSVILIILGAILLYKPNLLHSHDHDHKHEQGTQDNGLALHNAKDHCCQGQNANTLLGRLKELGRNKKFLPLALFGIGFVNMIIPCPTVAIMYGYALNSKSVFGATTVFGIYAISTAISVGAVIYLIFKLSTAAATLKKEWVEPLIIRLSGLVIVVFSGYGLYSTLVPYS